MHYDNLYCTVQMTVHEVMKEARDVDNARTPQL